MIRKSEALSLTDIRKKVKSPLFKKMLKDYAVIRLAVFGSVARGGERVSSDVDLLVEFGEKADLLDVVGFKQECEALLGKRVDVVTPNALHPGLREEILRQAVDL